MSRTPAKSKAERRLRRYEAQVRYRQSPRGRYQQHKFHARSRGVPFRLTFEQWWHLWEPFYEQRGNAAADQYVMCRKGDSGAYEVGNVEIRTHGSNVEERNRLYAKWRREYESSDFEHVHSAPDIDSSRPSVNGEPGPDVPF